MNVAIVDTGGANIASLRNAFARLGAVAQLTRDASEIRRATHVILPGVGAAADAMQRIYEAKLPDVIRRLTQPVLGICLGMQILFERSTEGDTDCLGILPGEVQRLPSRPGICVPHMGWNRVRNAGFTLLEGVDADAYFYFVHSFHAPTGPWTQAVSQHGDEFSAAVRRDNFFGVQFHPEKSAEVGAQLLRNFLQL